MDNKYFLCKKTAKDKLSVIKEFSSTSEVEIFAKYVRWSIGVVDEAREVSNRLSGKGDKKSLKIMELTNSEFQKQSDKIMEETGKYIYDWEDFRDCLVIPFNNLLDFA